MNRTQTARLARARDRLRKLRNLPSEQSSHAPITSVDPPRGSQKVGPKRERPAPHTPQIQHSRVTSRPSAAASRWLIGRRERQRRRRLADVPHTYNPARLRRSEVAVGVDRAERKARKSRKKRYVVRARARRPSWYSRGLVTGAERKRSASGLSPVAGRTGAVPVPPIGLLERLSFVSADRVPGLSRRSAGSVRRSYQPRQD